MNQNLIAKIVVSLWVTGVVSAVRNSHLAHASLHCLGRGEWLGWAGDTLLGCSFLPCWKHSGVGTFWGTCCQNSQKMWQNLKKTDSASLCLWKQHTKRFQGVLPHVLKTLGCIFCGAGGTDGGCLELGVRTSFNELTSPAFHIALVMLESPRGGLQLLHPRTTWGIAGQGWMPCVSTLLGPPQFTNMHTSG